MPTHSWIGNTQVEIQQRNKRHNTLDICVEETDNFELLSFCLESKK